MVRATKISLLRAAVAAGDWPEALRIAAGFARLGEARAAIMGAREALARPAFQRQLGRDPAALIEAGKAALNARYKLGAALPCQGEASGAGMFAKSVAPSRRLSARAAFQRQFRRARIKLR